MFLFCFLVSLEELSAKRVSMWEFSFRNYKKSPIRVKSYTRIINYVYITSSMSRFFFHSCFVGRGFFFLVFGDVLASFKETK